MLQTLALSSAASVRQGSTNLNLELLPVYPVLLVRIEAVVSRVSLVAHVPLDAMQPRRAAVNVQAVRWVNKTQSVLLLVALRVSLDQ